MGARRAVPSNWDQVDGIYFRLLAKSPICRGFSPCAGRSDFYPSAIKIYGVSHGSYQNGDFSDTLERVWLWIFCPLCVDSHGLDHLGFDGFIIGTGGDLRDLVHHSQSLGDLAEGRVSAV